MKLSYMELSYMKFSHETFIYEMMYGIGTFWDMKISYMNFSHIKLSYMKCMESEHFHIWNFHISDLINEMSSYDTLYEMSNYKLNVHVWHVHIWIVQIWNEQLYMKSTYKMLYTLLFKFIINWDKNKLIHIIWYIFNILK